MVDAVQALPPEDIRESDQGSPRGIIPKTSEVDGRGGRWSHGVGGQARLEKACGVIPEMLKVAALVEMMPPEVKDMVFMTRIMTR